MSVFTWIVRLGVALVFAVAGLAKLADQPGARRTVTGFSIPSVLAPAVAIVVTALELVIAVGLLFDPTAPVAALAALLLLGVFLLGLSLQLARGVEVPCACFGQVATTPAGWPTILRNVGLAIAAFYLVTQLS